MPHSSIGPSAELIKVTLLMPSYSMGWKGCTANSDNTFPMLYFFLFFFIFLAKATTGHFWRLLDNNKERGLLSPLRSSVGWNTPLSFSQEMLLAWCRMGLVTATGFSVDEDRTTFMGQGWKQRHTGSSKCLPKDTEPVLFLVEGLFVLVVLKHWASESGNLLKIQIPRPHYQWGSGAESGICPLFVTGIDV